MKVFGEKLEGQNYQKREGAYGIAINKQNEVAIIQMAHGDFLPGGGIEDGETEEECLKRELVEETGYDIEISQFVCKGIEYGFGPRSKKYLKLIGSFYKIKFKNDTGLKSEPDHKLVWKTLDELKDSMRLEYQLWAIKEAFKLRLVRV